MGFRQFSHHFREIAHALRAGDGVTAREYLARWRGASADELTPAEVARLSIELALAGSHRYVFGPIAAFVVFGPAGAVLYRLGAILADTWGTRNDAEAGEFGTFARRFFFFYDWIPARVTAASFAVVGNFEDAVYCWRTQARTWDGASQGILLASGGGALGVRLGSALHDSGTVVLRPELGLGDEADVDYMQSAIGLIWRALVLWMFLVFIVTVAHSLG
jgi:cobalamin biosynthesis protein CobD/CbiB